jgi:transglutaminase-like putative cysteine protease
MDKNQAQPERTWDWQSAALVVALIQISTSRLAVTEWVSNLDVPQTLGLWAVILGLAIGYSFFSPRASFLLAFLYGLVLIPTRLITALQDNQSLHQGLFNLVARLRESTGIFAANQPVYDALFFVTFASLVSWNMGIYMGYQWARHRRFLHATLPAGALILIVQVYDPTGGIRMWALAFYLLLALALLGRLHFLTRKEQWRESRVSFSSDAGWEFSRSAWTMALVAVFLAWVLPGALNSIGAAAMTWDEWVEPLRERFSNATRALDSPYNSATDGNFYGSSLRLGRKAPTSETPVFFVQQFSARAKSTRYYWRGRTYNHYEGGQWSNKNTTRESFDPDSDIAALQDVATRYEARFSITFHFPQQEMLYAPAEAVWTDQPSRWIITARDISSWEAKTALTSGEKYNIRTLVADPSVVELRGAGVAYPQWVKDAYLQIPAEIEPQITELANSVTRNAVTPFDKAEALAAFLRNEITYTTTLTETLPGDVDPLIWMLFENKKGFCMYTASAEVLMLRALGIPARMAVGFAQGEFDSDSARYEVTLRDSHAWAEAYFPNIGWVEFEPTGNQLPLTRIETPYQEEAAQPDSNQGEAGAALPAMPSSHRDLMEDVEVGGASPLGSWTRWLYPALLIALLALGGFFINRYSIVERLPVYLEGQYSARGRIAPEWLKRWSTWVTLIPAQRAFHAVDWSLRWLGNSQPATTTPTERADSLAKLMPAAHDAIMELKEELEFALFTNHPVNNERARRASWKVIIAAFRARF